ncbi:KilA-N domain-containing protein [Marinobacterium sp. BA1]|uniref:KilA-N domain-containing protein n=1 Tax=Marinobacterium sp. BA1 TaxID=3138931 RepID=UPI0034E8B2A0
MMQQIMKIDNLKIRTDEEGRFCLNDLHKAAGNEKRHAPSYWLNNQQTKELIDELETTGIPVVTAGGRKGGTYVCKELVYAYAMWISAAFHLKVIRAYDALINNQVELAQQQVQRERARLESRYLNDAVKFNRLDAGQPVKHYHFSNEYDLINRIALGSTAKQFRARHGLAANEAIRDHLSPIEMQCITHLQNIDTGLIEAGMTFEQRKKRLSRIYMQRYAARLCAEVERLEA